MCSEQQAWPQPLLHRSTRSSTENCLPSYSVLKCEDQTTILSWPQSWPESNGTFRQQVQGPPPSPSLQQRPRAFKEDLFFIAPSLPWWLRWQSPPAMWEAWVRSLGWEDPLEKEMATIPVFLPGESHGQRAQWATVLEVTQSQSRLSN